MLTRFPRGGDDFCLAGRLSFSLILMNKLSCWADPCDEELQPTASMDRRPLGQRPFRNWILPAIIRVNSDMDPASVEPSDETIVLAGPLVAVVELATLWPDS